MAIDIGRCRWELHQRILFVAHPRQPGLFDAISALVEFERLDALAQQTCQWWFEADGRCASVDAAGRCGACESEAELAEFVAAVLEEVKP